VNEGQAHHGSGRICPFCEQKLLTAHPYFSGWFHSLKVRYPDVHISWSYRDQADQDAFVKSGESDEPYPRSPHNKTDPQGNPRALALDLFQIDSEGKGVWSHQFFSQVNADNNAAKLPIYWGGNFKTLGDFDHFELRAGAC
jgi:hypothetical protein